MANSQRAGGTAVTEENRTFLGEPPLAPSKISAAKSVLWETLEGVGAFWNARPRQATSGIWAKGGVHNHLRRQASPFPFHRPRPRKGARALSLGCVRSFAFLRELEKSCAGRQRPPEGTLCSGITHAQHAGGPWLNPQRDHAYTEKSKFKVA